MLASVTQNKPSVFRLDRLHHAGAFLFFCAATALMLNPLLGQMSTALIGSAGDNLYYTWLIAWFQKAIFTLHQNPLVVPILNYPLGWHLAYTEVTLANVLPALAISPLTGPVLAYNAVLCLSFVLSGWIVYELAYGMTRNVAAGLLSGLLFAFTPYRVAHAYGHLPLIGTQWLAMHYAGLYFMLVRDSGRWKYALIAGAGFGLAALSSMYYLYMQLIVTPVAILLYLLGRRWSVLWKAVRKPAGLYVGIGLAFTLIAIYPYFQMVGLGESGGHTLQEVDIYSASITDYFIPSPVHFLVGRWVQATFGARSWIEHSIHLGLIAIGLALVAVFWKKDRLGQRDYRSLIRWLLGMILIVVVLSLGTTLHWLGEQVRIQIPADLRPWLQRSSVPIPLPGYVMFKYLPFYDGMRVWTRYGIFTALFSSLLAGIGAAFLLKSIRRRPARWVVLILLLAGVAIEYYPSYREFTSVQPRPVDLWLNDLPGDGAVAELPPGHLTDIDAILGTLYYNKPFLGVFYGAYLPKDFEQVALPILENFPDPRSVAYLSQRKVQYVVVHTQEYPEWDVVRQKIEELGLVDLGTRDDVTVYRIGGR